MNEKEAALLLYCTCAVTVATVHAADVRAHYVTKFKLKMTRSAPSHSELAKAVTCSKLLLLEISWHEMAESIGMRELPLITDAQGRRAVSSRTHSERNAAF
eukprot:IDg3970t1